MVAQVWCLSLGGVRLSRTGRPVTPHASAGEHDSIPTHARNIAVGFPPIALRRPNIGRVDIRVARGDAETADFGSAFFACQ